MYSFTLSLFILGSFLSIILLRNRIAGQNSRIVYLFKTLPGLHWVSRIAFHAEPFTLRQVVWIHDSNEIPHTFSMCDIQVLKAGGVSPVIMTCLCTWLTGFVQGRLPTLLSQYARHLANPNLSCEEKELFLTTVSLRQDSTQAFGVNNLGFPWFLPPAHNFL